MFRGSLMSMAAVKASSWRSGGSSNLEKVESGERVPEVKMTL